ncbi:electron transfer flavoprotein subunit alpha/FixB family protein [Oceanihabitans sediminis]|uniref:Electron transfer flavoprotein subunit alpha/FixB family protein n=1 Tax=Oceanihabitans sediminis TaxID=1812012 RepID=A0A368P7U7_9FLAO|nr:electron transfer flavoprotein subunit alpha/FixB family protein [Oceanihabitans sediminis]MDX1278401.1 electron transfer flavoprotein subunit alpha/FixB family protein [Oceanihabitans sediminis]MDX1772633.1 electron transfer flavoprotein subunit alpha/FixB family protein [Oceanihabitans sediminis]RBP34300.1 electron transfer flavoprotein alpha subunit apoprotein [Oceanihabitans sediminis]RCU57985.1 electron transfer flavoprotein subunit alpha/FixB family protein [Oceanihabitans sediminis]
MSVLVYTESEQGKLKKTALEVASYAKAVANQLGTTVTAVAINANDTSELGKYGVDKVLNVTNAGLDAFNAKAYADVLKQAAEKEGSKVVIVSSSADSKYLAPLLSVGLEAGFASNVVEAPSSTSPFTVKRTAFTNKAFNMTTINTDVKLVAVSNNSFGLVESEGSATAEDFSPSIPEINVKVESVDKATDKVSIADAEIVVSAGRGMKGPENWGMIEELAEVLGAATACSKPVSDLGWRPHSEHVGQTGKPVASNLYIAIGISGAIQHLAGINASKVKVVINTDPEAPFFKAADYGVVGDAFEVVPALIEKLKAFKAQQ